MKLRLKGFTLLEVLIAIGLLSLLMLMLFSALRTSTKAWAAVDKQSLKQTEQRHVSRFLIRRLQAIKPLYIKTKVRKEIAFIGEFQSVTFVTPMFEYTSMAGLYYLQYVFDSSSQQLQIRFVPYMDKEAPAKDIDQAEAELLLEHVTDFRVRYAKKGGAWVDAWHLSEFPALIGLNVTVAENKWPEIIVKTGS